MFEISSFGFVRSASLAIALVLGATAADAQVKTITLGHGLTEDSSYNVGATKFKELVEERLPDQIKVQVVCCARLGSDEEMFRRLQQGTLTATVISINNVGPVFPLIDVVHLPFMFKSREHMEKVMLGSIGDELNEKLKAATGTEILGYTDTVFRSLYNSKKEIKTPADMEGLKFRVPNNSVMIQTYQAFGVDPTPLGWAQTLSSTQTGLVDGGDLIPAHYFQTKMYEVAPYYSFTEHFPLISGIVISSAFMDGLTPEQQEIVREAGKEATAAARAYGDSVQEGAIEKMREAGVTFTTPDKAAFQATVAELVAGFGKERGPEAEALIKEVVKAGE